MFHLGLLHAGKVWLLVIPPLNPLHSRSGSLGFSRQGLVMLQGSTLSFFWGGGCFQSGDLLCLSPGWQRAGFQPCCSLPVPDVIPWINPGITGWFGLGGTRNPSSPTLPGAGAPFTIPGCSNPALDISRDGVATDSLGIPSHHPHSQEFLPKTPSKPPLFQSKKLALQRATPSLERV